MITGPIIFFTFLGPRPGILIKGITIDDLQEIGKKHPWSKHRFTMCCRMGTIAYRWDINNLVGNESETTSGIIHTRNNFFKVQGSSKHGQKWF